MMLFMAAIVMVMMLFVTTSAAVPLLAPAIAVSIVVGMRVVLVAGAAALAGMVMLVAGTAAVMVRMCIVLANISLVAVALAGAFVLGRFGCHALSFPFSIPAKSTFLLQPLQVFLCVAILEYPKSASKNGLSNLPRFR